jgi:hypothetical protein
MAAAALAVVMAAATLPLHLHGGSIMDNASFNQGMR